MDSISPCAAVQLHGARQLTDDLSHAIPDAGNRDVLASCRSELELAMDMRPERGGHGPLFFVRAERKTKQARRVKRRMLPWCSVSSPFACDLVDCASVLPFCRRDPCVGQRYDNERYSISMYFVAMKTSHKITDIRPS